MITGRSCSGKRTRPGAPQCRQVAYIVELKFTSDDRVHGAALKEALAQHAALASRLESRGFTVQLMPIIVGSSGMIRAETQQYFATLGLTTTDCLSLMQEHHNTAITYLRKILQQYQVLPSPSPTPRSKPRRAPKRKNTAGLSSPPDPTSHKRALPATPSAITRSVKRAKIGRVLYQNPTASPDSAPCTVRPWDRLIFSIGKNTGSVRRLKRRTRSDHTELREQDRALHLPSTTQRNTRPHTPPPPPAAHMSGCTTTAPAQNSAKRVCLDTQPHSPTTSAEADLLFESAFEPASDTRYWVVILFFHTIIRLGEHPMPFTTIRWPTLLLLLRLRFPRNEPIQPHCLLRCTSSPP